jgi:conjugal transfer pilus assembly protein TraW
MTRRKLNPLSQLVRCGLSCAPMALAICFAFGHGTSNAEDLGVKADTYLPDPDGRDELKEAVRQRQQSGALDQFWRHYRDQVVNAIRHPAPLPIRTEYRATSEFHPVSFTMPSDFVDQNGKVVAHRGQVIEPLAILPLTSALVFIDGRDQQQVDWVLRVGQSSRVKIILTGGSAIELREKYKDSPWLTGQGVPFYLDQRAMIINSLQRMYGIKIESVPATLRQEGKGLRIDYGMRGAR